MKEIQTDLFAMQDMAYRDFHARLMPTVSKETIIGVRVPALRRYARDFFKKGDYQPFLEELPHQYYEENNLHAFLIEQIKDYHKCMAELEKFLPYIDNWATCDMLKPKVLSKHLPELLEKIGVWIKSDETYTVRFGIGMLMTYYLDEAFHSSYLDMVACIRSEEYYINMMIAWFFATALAKQYESTLPYLLDQKLPVWVHNKTIQKAVESHRITEEQKVYLKTLKR